MKNGGARKKLPSAVFSAIIWFNIWLCLSVLAKRTGYGLLIPTPYEAAGAFGALLKQKNFYLSCLFSLLRVAAGWFSGLVGGTLLAIVTKRSRALSAFFAPALHIIRATPVASFIVLALVLMNKSAVPVFTGFLMALPVVWANVERGLSASDPRLLEMAAAFGMSRKNELKYIRIPALVPYFTAAATTSMGLTWKACVAAEVICTPRGSVGAGIYNAKVYLETPSLFAWTLTVVILSMLLEKLLKAVMRGGRTE